MSKIIRRIPEFRALNNEKGLVEQRWDLMNEMEGIINKSKSETRTLTDDENKRFEEIKGEIKKIDNTLKAIEEERALQDKKPTEKQKEQRAIDEENFLKFIKGEERALDVASNGGVITVSIANKIIEKVKELSPIYSLATLLITKLNKSKSVLFIRDFDIFAKHPTMKLVNLTVVNF